MKNFFSNFHPLILGFTLLVCLGTLPAWAQTVAFPGAEGFGRFATGGRGGEVYIVTNLNDSGPGSFRDAVSRPNRIVVFEVGGVIKINSRVVVSPNITIAGQTAPGNGVVIYGNGLSFSSASNTIVRYLRMRMGVGGDSGKDAVTITDNAKDQIYDHVSVSWGRDENFSITGNADRITVQNSIIAQGLQTHSCGGLLEPSGAISLYRNLYVDNHTRNPKVKGTNQFVNNIVYNWGGGGAYIMGGSQGESRVNIINNYYIAGPNSTAETFTRGTPTFVPYVDGNFQDLNRDGTLNGSEVPRSEYEGITTFRETPYDYPMPAKLLSAQEAYAVVLENVGASYPSRDENDALVINELISLGSKGFIPSRESELPTKGPGNVFGAPAPNDTDRDGMPDAWETAQGLDLNNPADGKTLNPDGYTNLEKYINGITATTPPAFIKPPSNLAISGLTETKLNLAWTDNSEEEREFVLERSTNGTDYTPLATLTSNTTSYTDEGLTPNRTYYYRLKAVGETAASVYSVVAFAKTLPVPSAPEEPTNPTPATGSRYAETGPLTLSWTGSTNTSQYHVYFGTDASALEKRADLTASNYLLSGLAENTTYYWRVDASNELGLTTGEIWSFTTARTYPNGVVGKWTFDETSGTTVTDHSPFENHGELVDITDIAWVPGKVNNGVDLATGSASSHIRVPHEDHLHLNKHPFTISLWVKGPAQTEQSYLIHKGTFVRNATTGATGKWYGIEIKTGMIRFAIDDDVTKSEVAFSNSTFFTDEWVHVAAVRDTQSKKIRLYRNGVQVAEANDNTLQGIGQTDAIVIGNTSDLNTPFKGQLDEVQLFNYGLSPAEISVLASASITGLRPKKEDLGFTCYPTAFSDRLTLSFQLPRREEARLAIYDRTGSLVEVLATGTLEAGSHQIAWNVTEHLPSGLYLCVLQTATGRSVKRVVHLR